VPVAVCLYETARPAAIAGAIAAASCVCLRVAYPPHATASVLIEGGCVGMIYLLALLTVGFDSNTRGVYLTHARAATRALTGCATRGWRRRAADVEPEPLVAARIITPQ
jgi:hypothetical protein